MNWLSPPFSICACFLNFLFLVSSSAEEPLEVHGNVPAFVTTPTEEEVVSEQPAPEETQPRSEGFQSEAVSLYSHGDPTDSEQLSLELINRSRADANAEAQRLVDIINTQSIPEVFSAVDFFRQNTNNGGNGDYTITQVINELIAQYATLPQNQPPLAFHPLLIQASRQHSQDMFDNTYQGHFSSPNAISTYGYTDTNSNGFISSFDRVLNLGYNRTAVGENVFSSSESEEHGHAGFEIDWGFGPFGIQTPPGHRNTIHDNSGLGYREIGIGIVKGTATAHPVYQGGPNGSSRSPGPQVLTQVFARQSGAVPLFTGVAYFDLNGNGFYDIGEGIPGVRVEVDGEDNYAITSTSGGYAIPISGGNGNYTLTFSGAGFNDDQRLVTLSSLQNQKIDFVPTYMRPELITEGNVYSGFDNILSFNAVGGSTGYRVRVSEVTSGDVVKDIEDDAVGFTFEPSSPPGGGSYNYVQSNQFSSASKAIQMVNVGFVDVSFVLPGEFLVQSSSVLEFDERLMFSGGGQFCLVQVSTDGGSTWNTEYSRNESILSSGNWDSGFTTRSLPLAAYDGQSIRVRFLYDSAGSTITGYGSTTGWFLDDIALRNVKTLGSQTEQDFGSGGTFTFNPSSAGDYLVEVRSINGSREFPYGTPVELTAMTGPPPDPELTGMGFVDSGATHEVHFKMANATMGEAEIRGHQNPLMLSSQPALSGVSVEYLGNGYYRFLVPAPASDTYFYQVSVTRSP